MPSAALHVLSAPKTINQEVLVRFLGDPRGILTHCPNKTPFACTGPDTCRHHKVLARWKGYAPGQEWRPDERAWFPVVIEVTSGLAEQTGVHGLRGQAWKIQRVKRFYGSKAVEGRLVHTYESGDLPRAFDVTKTVARLYECNEIVWDVDIDGHLRETAEVSCEPLPFPEHSRPAKVEEPNHLLKEKLAERFNARPEKNGSAKKT